MDEARLIDLLVELHEGLSRLGPGDADCTRKAFACCNALPPVPTVLDVGCGTGAQALELAAATRGTVTAADLHLRFVAHLRCRAWRLRLSRPIRPLAADMQTLPFRDASFDLIWSEGAVYTMGFDTGLAAWRSLLRRRGYLVVSELSWFRPDPPAWLRDYWRANYPAMRSITANLAGAARAGFEVVAHFRLPAEAWEEYYAPLAERLPGFRRRYGGDPDAQAVASMTEEEMNLMRRAAGDCGYAFYVLRRTEG